MPDSPPVATPRPVADYFHGARVIDSYRWLEKADSPEVQKWVSEENGYTRALLDPLPGRDGIHKRLTELLSIGNIGAPVLAGHHYFYTRREGLQNQPVLYVRDGSERIRSRSGGCKLYFCRRHSRARLVSAFRERQVCGLRDFSQRVGDVDAACDRNATGTILPDTIERTRAASIAWQHDNSGFYYTRYPKKGEVPAGQEIYNRHVYFHLLGSPEKLTMQFLAKGAAPRTGPAFPFPMMAAGC